jgi:hypothetical protein
MCHSERQVSVFFFILKFALMLLVVTLLLTFLDFIASINRQAFALQYKPEMKIYFPITYFISAWFVFVQFQNALFSYLPHDFGGTVI